jgi:hypothetical protein
MCVYRIWLVMDGDGPLPPVVLCLTSGLFPALCNHWRPPTPRTDLPALQEKGFRRALPLSLSVLYLFSPPSEKSRCSARIVCSSVQLTRLPPAALTPRVLPSNNTRLPTFSLIVFSYTSLLLLCRFPFVLSLLSPASIRSLG